MIYLYIGLGIFFGVILIMVLIGFASPRVAKMQRSIEINTNVDKVWPQLNNLKNFVDNWSPWTEKDPNAVHTFNDVSEGVGNAYTWKGAPKKVGEGSMEIVESEVNKKVRTSLEFKGRGKAIASFYVEDAGDGKIKVTWDFAGDNGNNPIARLFGRFMDKFLGPDYETGLNKLKSYCEA